MNIAVYPGSFDPITLGHLNIIKRAAAVFDKLYVCVSVNSEKHTLFTMEERMDLIARTVKNLKKVEVDAFDGLIVNYAREKGAKTIVKGLRAVSDFDYEFQIAMANKKIDPSLDTFFLASSEKYTYLSSTVVKEMAKYGADIGGFVPREIIKDVVNKLNSRG